MTGDLVPQNDRRNNFKALIAASEEKDFLWIWFELYFEIEVTALPSSQKVQKRDLTLFIEFMIEEEGTDLRSRWTPRLSSAFKGFLQNVFEGGKRRWNDKTVNRILAHLKTFAKWVHKMVPFPLGDPMEKMKSISVGNSLEIERALTPPERRRLLDGADLLIETGGRSKDRTRYHGKERPLRKGYRPYRNRAIIYTLIETGMRREAITKINLDDIDFDRAMITVVEKGSVQHAYNISNEGLNAIRDYIVHERGGDEERWRNPALFLVSATIVRGDGRLTPQVINTIWNQVCEKSGIKSNKTPHSARHAMGKFIMDKTGNIAAVQRQLGHKNAAYSMQYARITNDALKNILDDR
jgi:site-specific recombinase XerD